MQLVSNVIIVLSNELTRSFTEYMYVLTCLTLIVHFLIEGQLQPRRNFCRVRDSSPYSRCFGSCTQAEEP